MVRWAAVKAGRQKGERRGGGWAQGEAESGTRGLKAGTGGDPTGGKPGRGGARMGLSGAVTPVTVAPGDGRVLSHSTPEVRQGDRGQTLPLDL